MRILLLSDTHGCTERMEMVLAECGPINAVIHCGDVDRDCDALEKLLGMIPLISVCGNNDRFSHRPFWTTYEAEGIRFYVTHGHLERVRDHYNTLAYHAAEENCQVALFGHTHQRADIDYNGIRLINPGALSASSPSYAILELKQGTVKVTFHEIET